jgi:hypothetical protein
MNSNTLSGQIYDPVIILFTLSEFGFFLWIMSVDESNPSLHLWFALPEDKVLRSMSNNVYRSRGHMKNLKKISASVEMSTSPMRSESW